VSPHPETDADRKKSTEELCNEIHHLAHITTQGTMQGNAIRAVGKFSAILIQLSVKADEQSTRLIALTRTLKWLTIALIVVGVIDITLRLFGR